ncbi:hypothetical protein BV25DRAFT_677088 [Artomyces pyxidatus]|uniref:Uncharacterized protein n=1 Tax=Artomyces pyxidatus TaxID=48021 RepID=A0ACB8T1U8_9AGAM|nr:hypothetical protein BV25DRAFT_677088 [Artomyces pyxidatus]
MPSFPVGVRAFHREIARTIQSRNESDSTQAQQQASPSSSPVAPNANLTHLSTSVKSLIGIFVVVGLLVMIVSAWKVRSAYRRKHQQAAKAGSLQINVEKGEKGFYPVTLADTNQDVSEPHKAVLNPSLPSDPSVGWVPQIRDITLPSGVTVPSVAVPAPSHSPGMRDLSPKSAGYNWSPPPPTYGSVLLNSIPPPPPPPPSANLNAVPPPTPPASRKSQMSVDVNIRESFDVPPLPSPRTASIAQGNSTPSQLSARGVRTSISNMLSGKPSLPRLMIVSTAFTPSRDDELAARAGETLRMLEEFEDQWCLVQRVGRSDAEKGVIPRFCLTERPSVVEKQRLTFAFTGQKRT